MQTKHGVVFPDLAKVQIVSRDGSFVMLGDVVFFVRLFATQKNDYHLGPFASDERGLVTIDRAACDNLVAAVHESGLMDYSGIQLCRPEVEIRHLTHEEVERAANARRTIWRNLLRGEDVVFGSMDALLATYDRATNAGVVGAAPIRALWDGSASEPSYTYVVDRVAPA